MKTFILTRRDLSRYGPQKIRWTGRKFISSRKIRFWGFVFYQKITFGPIWGSGPKKGSKLDPHGPKGSPIGPKGSPLVPKGPFGGRRPTEWGFLGAPPPDPHLVGLRPPNGPFGPMADHGRINSDHFGPFFWFPNPGPPDGPKYYFLTNTTPQTGFSGFN